MSFTSKGSNEILVAGCQAHMYKIDIERGVITSSVSLGASTKPLVLILTASRSMRKDVTHL